SAGLHPDWTGEARPHTSSHQQDGLHSICFSEKIGKHSLGSPAMSQIGSFALLLALGLSAYSFLAGLLALFSKDAASARLGEPARRAGIATFAAVLLAAIVLVVSAFSDDF